MSVLLSLQQELERAQPHGKDVANCERKAISLRSDSLRKGTCKSVFF